MNLAVTGGSGRLGRAVLPLLLENGHQVRSLDWGIDPSVKSKFPQVDWIELDIKDLEILIESVKGCEAIIHLAAFPGLHNYAPGVVYVNNTCISYNVLRAAAALGIRKVCLASSINALGGLDSKLGRFDYFPVDENHATYNADEYSLSKWIMEQQADSFARRDPEMTISSLRLHALPDEPPELQNSLDSAEAPSARGLWGWTLLSEAARACTLAFQADLSGHEVFFITARRTYSTIPSRELARHAYPNVPIRGELDQNCSFYDCSKAEKLLGWTHIDI